MKVVGKWVCFSWLLVLCLFLFSQHSQHSQQSLDDVAGLHLMMMNRGFVSISNH